MMTKVDFANMVAGWDPHFLGLAIVVGSWILGDSPQDIERMLPEPANPTPECAANYPKMMEGYARGYVLAQSFFKRLR